MNVLARIPELPRPPGTTVARDGHGTAAEEGPGSALARPAPPPRRGWTWRWPRIPTGSITALALVAAAIWSLVAWREGQDARDARAAVRLARQPETTTTAERAR